VTASRKGARRVALAIGLAAAALAAGPTSGAMAQSDFVGVVAEDVFAGDTAYRAQALAAQRQLGIGVIRQTFHWNQIEVSPGVYDWGAYDAYMRQLAQNNMKVLPILFSPPAFYSKTGSRRGTYPPKSNGTIAGFGAAIAARYGPNGSFWAQNPDVPKVPVTAYQVWNEPNLPVYWPTGPKAKEYARMLKAVSSGVKKVDPAAEIVTAGMPQSVLSKQTLLEYLEDLYKAKGKTGFDTLAVNPYARNGKELVKRLRDVRKLMNRYRDRRAKIWVTEIGWATEGPSSPFRKGTAGQAQLTSAAVRSMQAQRSRLGLRGFVLYSWKDSPPYPGGKDFWGLHTGLLDANGAPKPVVQNLLSVIPKV
jgi:hypothetical protein